jgi:beta-N-acetylhexosaminidase
VTCIVDNLAVASERSMRTIRDAADRAGIRGPQAIRGSASSTAVADRYLSNWGVPMNFRRRCAVVAALIAVAGAGACSAPSRRTGSAPTPSQTVAPTGAAIPTPSVAPTLATGRDACVAATVATMSLEQIVSQVMLIGAPVTDPRSVSSVLSKYQVGGVFLAGRSKRSAAALKSDIASLQAQAPSGNRFFIALDQEGGEVQTLQGPDFPPIPTAVQQGKLSQTALHDQTAEWAKRLAAIGINLDLAPVADTVPAALGTKNPPIGLYHRQFGSDPVQVAEAISTVVPALQDASVMTTLKHFPGLGRTKVNTDFGTGASDPVTTPSDPYLGPFVAGIKAGSGAVMIASATYPKLDPKHIATFSEPIITGLLRERLGFTGMIVSDSLAGAAAVSIVPTKNRAVQFIQAGGDFALTTDAGKGVTMIKGLLAEAQVSPAFRTRVTAAASSVLRAKYDAGLLGCSPQP